MRFCFKVLLLVCVVSSAFANPRFLTISDIHYGQGNTSVDGQNTGDGLLAVSMAKLKELSQNVDFVLNLGDVPTHSINNAVLKGIYEKTVFHDLFVADVSNKPMFYVAGNNDSLAGNYQPFEMDGKSPLNFADDWSGACVNCDGLIIDGSHMLHHGYYSSYVMPNNNDVILIVLNATQLTNIPKYASPYPNQDADAKEQLDWLRGQLSAHSGKQLLIAMHEPPGKDYKGKLVWKAAYLNQFISLLNQYQDSYAEITLLTSHTHMDEIRLIKLKKRNVYAYSTPAVSRVHYNNSGMKIFELSNDMKVANFTTYYTTSISQWDNALYQAIGKKGTIFPECDGHDLVQCLDALSPAEVSRDVKAGLFYGVKNKKVNNDEFAKTYLVN